LEKGLVSSQLNWEIDPEEIVRVVFKLMGKGLQNGRRKAFFFQCLGGHYDKASRTFKWACHPPWHC